MRTEKDGSFMCIGALLFLTFFSVIMLTIPGAMAEGTVDTVQINIAESCSMSGVVNTAHTKTIQSDHLEEDIGTTNIKIVCNDASGFAVYAIGYTDDEYGKTVLTDSTLGSTSDIATGLATSGNTSSWAMKLAKAGSTYSPIIAGSSEDTYRQTGDTDYSGYAVVPSEYAKVVYRLASTDVGTGASGSNFTTTYRVFISRAQLAGTYVGQVKYTLVHPNTAAAPLQTYTMQDVASWKSKIATNQEIKVIDSRDGKEYTAAKLADGNIWMTQNLDHDIDSTYNYNSSNTDVPSNWSDTLTSTYTTNNPNSWLVTIVTPESYDPGDLCWNGAIGGGGTLANSTVACGDDKHYHIGNYYNWPAAVAMADTSSFNNYTDVNQSICPAGWMLPKGSSNNTGSGSFIYLVNQLHLTGGTSGNAHTSPVYFVYGGSWVGSSNDVGNYGFYWSSVVNNSYVNAYDLQLDQLYGGGASSDVYYGHSVRCVAR